MALFLAVSVPGQDPGTSKQAKKEASRKIKEEREAQIARQFTETGKMLSSRRFVLEANYLINKMGERKPVTPVLNFIAVDSIFSVIQVGTIQGIGSNGAGGITGEGRITNWKFSQDEKRKYFDIFLSVNSTVGIYDIALSVDYSAYGSASLSGLRSGTIQFNGNIVPIDSSRVYKGQIY